MRNRFYLWLVFISGLILLAFLGLAVRREMTPEWKKYQVEYREEAVRNAKEEATRKSARLLRPEVQQIYLASLNRVDRCTSCHIGIDNPLMTNARAPLKEHSGKYLKNHPVDKFGCTICHYGQGRATNKKEAHGIGHDAHWDHPKIPMEYVQSSCSQCHDLEMLNVSGGENIANGEQLFREKGCKGCHKLEDVGGIIGKPLDGVGSQPVAYFAMTAPGAMSAVKGDKTIYSWMKQHFDDPRNLVLGSEMKSDFTDIESDLLTTFVLSLRSEEMPKKYRRLQNATTVSKEYSGEALYRMYCVACHTTGKESVNDEVFKRTIPAIMNQAFLKTLDNAFLKKIIEEGRAGTQMTAWKASAAGLTDREIASIISYITKDRPRERPEPFEFSRYRGNVAHGEELYRIRCISCHGNKGQGGVGLNLRNPIVQKEADPEFLAITVRDGRDGTHMAAFGKKGVGLSDQDIADIVTYIKTLLEKK